MLSLWGQSKCIECCIIISICFCRVLKQVREVLPRTSVVFVSNKGRSRSSVALRMYKYRIKVVYILYIMVYQFLSFVGYLQESTTVYLTLPHRRLSMGIGGPSHYFLAAAIILHRCIVSTILQYDLHRHVLQR